MAKRTSQKIHSKIEMAEKPWEKKMNSPHPAKKAIEILRIAIFLLYQNIVKFPEKFNDIYIGRDENLTLIWLRIKA